MNRLGYSTLVSLDGYVNDAAGDFRWAAPDAEVHSFVNDLERGVGTYLYGRRMYETMTFWETVLEQPDVPDVERDYAEIWRAADKIVYSTTLTTPTTERTRLERRFDPAAVQRLKEESPGDLSIGGPELAKAALRAGLVDDLRLFLMPVVIGGGQHFVGSDLPLEVELVTERRLGRAVYLHYRVGAP